MNLRLFLNKFYFIFLLIALGFTQSCVKKVEDNPYSIVLWEMEDAQIAPFIDEIINNFKKYYKEKYGIELKFTRAHYQVEDLRQQFQAASLANVPPDLLISPSDTAGVYAIGGFIKNVDELFDMSIYNRPVVEAITLEKKIWGVPISNGNHLMLMYNKKFVKSPPTTTDELFNYCETEAKKNKFL
jgi:arabinogalactan oligomer/maltooligosaccharide transport system substrate-binding protein